MEGGSSVGDGDGVFHAAIVGDLAFEAIDGRALSEPVRTQYSDDGGNVVLINGLSPVRENGAGDRLPRGSVGIGRNHSCNLSYQLGRQVNELPWSSVLFSFQSSV